MKNATKKTTTTTIQTEWFDYWFKVPIAQCGNNELAATLADMKAKGLFVHTMTVKQGGYELHSRKD
jgi:hypothetical protein